MANQSNWKGSEEKAAKLVPGGRRRTRTQGFSYATVADDVIFGPETFQVQPPRVIKQGCPEWPAVYVEVKKRAKIEAVTIFKATEKKYFTQPTDRLVLVLHAKHDPRQFVMLSDDFFAEVFTAWCREKRITG